MRQGGFPSLSVLRAALALVAAVDLLSFLFFLPQARAATLADGAALTTFNDLLSRTAVVAVVVLIGVASALAFGRRPGRLWEGLLLLAALSLLSTVHAQLFGSPWRHLYYSGLCLAGWLLGLAVSRQQGAPADESYARTGSIALLGAAYLNAGISKIVYGGGDWISSVPIQAVIVAQDGLVGDSLLSAYRVWVVTTPGIAAFFALATLLFELAAPLMIAGRWVRLGVALGLFAMHANIYLLTHILYWESMLLLLLFGTSADAPPSQVLLRSTAAARSRDRWFAASVILLALLALLAIGYQARRYAQLQEIRAAAIGSGADPEPPSPSTP